MAKKKALRKGKKLAGTKTLLTLKFDDY